VLAFALMMTTSIYLIIDLDFPRFGFIRLDFADQGLLDLLARMKYMLERVVFEPMSSINKP